MPPVRGNEAASSASVSAPHSAITAPATQTRSAAGSDPARRATFAGVLKMPVPMVALTTSAMPRMTPISRRIADSGMPDVPSGDGGEDGEAGEGGLGPASGVVESTAPVSHERRFSTRAQESGTHGHLDR